MRRVRDVAKLLDLEPFLDRKPRNLSGGQRQRVAMGRAIVRHPQVYLMDEPLSNLDAKLRVQTRTELVELQQRLAVTTVYVTHDQVEAMTMGHRVAVLRDGELQQCDKPSTLYHAPANLFVAGFIGSPAMNMLSVANGGGPVRWRVPSSASQTTWAQNAPRSASVRRPSSSRRSDPRTDPYRRGSRLRGLRPPRRRARRRRPPESWPRSTPRSPERPAKTSASSCAERSISSTRQG
jgi:multiple sugar transport system ATP-binding protein